MRVWSNPTKVVPWVGHRIGGHHFGRDCISYENTTTINTVLMHYYCISVYCNTLLVYTIDALLIHYVLVLQIKR